MRSILAGLRTLVLPWGAPANTPAIILGPDVPPRLQAYYAAGGPNSQVATVIGAQIFQQDSTDFVYEALCIPTVGKMFLAFGAIEGIGLVMHEAYRITAGSIGANVANTFYGITNHLANFGIGSSVADPALTPFTIDGMTQGRGLLVQVDDPLASAAIGAVETVTLTLPSATYRAGRAYAPVLRGIVGASVANTMVVNIRKTNATGQQLARGAFDHRDPVAGQTIAFDDVFVVGAADVTAVLVQTTVSTAGTTTWLAANPAPRRLRIINIGAAADYPDSPVLV